MSRLLLAAVVLAPTLAFAQPPDRSTAPVPGAAPVLILPAVQQARLSNGLGLRLVEMHEVPVVRIALVFRNGAAADPAGKPGVASLTAAMLDEGAGSRSALEISDEAAFLGASLATGSSYDASFVSVGVPVARLEPALALLADVALRPTFPKDELERQRQERLTSLLQGRDDPATIAAVTFARVLFGVEHRYGTPLSGTAETIKAFTTDDLRAFYQSVFRPDNAAMLVVGDVKPDTVVPMLEKQFGSWRPSGSAAPPVKFPPVEQPATRTVYLVDKPGAPQSQIRIGWIGVPRATPDYFPLVVMNTILGGSFSSRLNMNLREQHGYTYGASSAFDMRASAGPFVAAAGVQTDKTSEALKEFFNELNGILQAVPADELARAKNYVALRYPSSFETTGDISRRLEDALIFHLPDDYFSKYVQNIQAVTAADVHRVAQKYVAPGKFAVVVVGDLKTIEPGVKALNLGPVKVTSVDDVFGPKP